jgi:hypothetical protein
LDTALGVAEGTLAAPLMAMAESEPDLSARYRLPASPAEPVDQVRAAYALMHAVEGLDLDRAAHRLLVWADSWSAGNLAGLVSLIEAARAAGGAR